MFRFLKRIVYIMIFIFIFGFCVNKYIDYKVQKLFDNFKTEQLTTVNKVKEKGMSFFEGGFFK